MLASAADVQRHAGTTPVALFTAHRVSRETALTANFSELIEKPFDLGTFTDRSAACSASEPPSAASAKRAPAIDYYGDAKTCTQ